jgi:hypothetical protein
LDFVRDKNRHAGCEDIEPTCPYKKFDVDRSNRLEVMTQIGKQRWWPSCWRPSWILLRTKFGMQNVRSVSLQVLIKFGVDSSNRLEVMTHIRKQDGCWGPSWI